jgi:hypothetical protein
VNNREQIVTSAEFEHGLDGMHSESLVDLAEIAPALLAGVAGGPAGSVTPDGGTTVPPVNK